MESNLISYSHLLNGPFAENKYGQIGIFLVVILVLIEFEPF